MHDQPNRTGALPWRLRAEPEFVVEAGQIVT